MSQNTEGDPVLQWCIKHPKDGFLLPSYSRSTPILLASYSNPTAVLLGSCPWEQAENRQKQGKNLMFEARRKNSAQTAKMCTSRTRRSIQLPHPLPLSRRARENASLLLLPA